MMYGYREGVGGLHCYLQRPVTIYSGSFVLTGANFWGCQTGVTYPS